MTWPTPTKEAYRESCTFSIDGDQVCCWGPEFTNMMESPVGFGDTEDKAFEDYIDEAFETYPAE